MPIFSDNAESIGRTPLVRINRIIEKPGITVLAKIESRNPLFSVKCRIGAAMIWDALERGALRKGMEVIEPTSGNTGIALAYVCAAKGYPLTLTMPDTMSIERRKVLSALGARLKLSDGAKGMKGAIDKAREICESDPGRYFMPQQFENPANPGIHEKTTGPEIWEDTQGKVDAIVAGVGTGGTITGVSRFLKKTKKAPVISIAVEPKESPVLTQARSGREQRPGKHKIQGIGAGFVPGVLDMDLVDRVQKPFRAKRPWNLQGDWPGKRVYLQASPAARPWQQSPSFHKTNQLRAKQSLSYCPTPGKDTCLLRSSCKL